VSCILLFSQLANLSDALPQLESKFHQLSGQIVQWISENFNLSTQRVNKWIDKIKVEGMGSGTLFIGQTISSITGILIFIFLVPVYMFMFLYYKPLLLEFVARLFPTDQHATVAEVMLESKKLIQSYLLGLAIEAGIMIVLNSTALLIIGTDYAILIGIIGALLNVIPYVGGVTSLLIALIFTLVTRDTESAVWVFVAYSAIQFIDNNYIVPKIVASKVRVNALISLIVVFIGGALWGLPGMFLSLPVTAILKVIFDRIETLKPWGFLVGDTMPSIYGTIFKIRRRKSSQS
jgi:predicted PurR-regulated permease PerM